MISLKFEFCNIYKRQRREHTLGARGLSRALISLILHASYVSYIYAASSRRRRRRSFPAFTKACRESTSGTQGTENIAEENIFKFHIVP